MTDRSNLTTDALRLSRLHDAARLEAQRLRRCAFRQAFEALARALRDLRGTARALPAPSGSVHTPPQTSPCAA